MALDEVDETLGIKYIRNFHRWVRLCHPNGWCTGDGSNVAGVTIGSMPNIPAEVDESDIASWTVKTNDTVLFNHRTTYGTTDRVIRRGLSTFSTHWMGDDTRYFERPEGISTPHVDLNLALAHRMRKD